MKNMHVQTQLTFLLFLGLGSALPVQAEELPLNYRKEFQLPASAQNEEAFLAVELDAEVYAHTKKNLADIRILNPGGKQVPYLLHAAVAKEAKKSTRHWSANNPGLKPLDGEGLEITVHLNKDDPTPDSVQLVTPLKNFEQQVQVSTSTDGKEWSPLGEEELIYDYSQYMDVRNTRIPLQGTNARYFRFVVDKVTAEQESQLLELTKKLQGGDETARTERTTIERRPFRIDRIEFAAEVTTKQYAGTRTRDYPVEKFETVQKPAEKQTWLEITTQREPLTEFRLQTSEKNFSRAASVQMEIERGGSTDWQPIGNDNISRIDFKSLHKEELTLKLPETRAKRYRIVIENRDSPALDFSGVTAIGNVYELVFLAESSRSDSEKSEYQLAYGGDVSAANYDTAAIQRVLGSTFAPEVVMLGEQTTIDPADIPEQPFSWADLLNNKPLLFTVIGLLVLAVGWGLFQAAKRVEQLPPE